MLGIDDPPCHLDHCAGRGELPTEAIQVIRHGLHPLCHHHSEPPVISVATSNRSTRLTPQPPRVQTWVKPPNLMDHLARVRTSVVPGRWYGGDPAGRRRVGITTYSYHSSSSTTGTMGSSSVLRPISLRPLASPQGD